MAPDVGYKNESENCVGFYCLSFNYRPALIPDLSQISCQLTYEVTEWVPASMNEVDDGQWHDV